MTPASESTLLVPVHDGGDVVARLRERIDPAWSHGLPAHITVLYPFGAVSGVAEAQVDDLADAIASCPAFSFTLSAVGWFDDRVLYLAPDDPEPFVALTSLVASMFPAFPPYRGAYDAVVPHMTVGEGAKPWRMRRAARLVRKVLPIEGTADAVWWMAPSEGGRWAVTRRFSLGLNQGKRGLPSL